MRGLPVGEFDWLDFKDSRWLDLSASKWMDDLSPYISAFANYDGGCLVIGVRDPKTGQELEIDAGVPINVKNNLKSWLEDIIPNLVDPPIQRLNVHLITDPAGNAPAAGNALVVFHIPPSDAAPHQARDHKYYTRVGSKNRAIGNKAVLDILNRKRNPIVQTEIYVNFPRSGCKGNVFWRVTNLSNVFVRYVMTRMEIPISLNGNFINFEGETIQVLEDNETVAWRFSLSNHLAHPLFPHGTVSRQFDFILMPPFTTRQTLPFIRYRTFADHMDPIEGTISIDDALNITRKNNESKAKQISTRVSDSATTNQPSIQFL